MRRILLLAYLSWHALTGNAAMAQTMADSIPLEIMPATEEVPEVFAHALDELYEKWYVDRNAANRYRADSLSPSTNLLTCTDEVYLARLDSIHSAIPLSYNGIVRNFIELYTVKKRKQVATMLGLSEYYFPIFEEALEQEGLPHELKYLPVIESALNPRARSSVGACGLWQFILSTGKLYKLEINSFVDERRDPSRSSKVAARFLKDLYAIYNDWMLVIAAYNCGPGNVNKAIRRSGNQKNYWSIYYHLPKETRGHVPAFIAAMYVFNYHEKHGIYPVENKLPTMCDSIVLTRALHFDQVASLLDISVEELRDLNPQYRGDVIPAGFGRTYTLQLPYNHVGNFIDKQDTIFAHRRDYYFNDNDRTVDPRNRVRNYAQAVPRDKAKITYTVKSGDVLGTIANKFNVKIADLRYWNNVNGNLIRVGQKLVVYVPRDKVALYEPHGTRYSEMTTNAETLVIPLSDGEFTVYTIKQGESLWTIAQKFPGVTNEDIMQWNGISSEKAKSLKPGQKLKIQI
jgi:membrane-bound lytic murein transglycosylase D